MDVNFFPENNSFIYINATQIQVCLYFPDEWDQDVGYEFT